MAQRIILASTSPRRHDILSKTDLVFEILPADFEEDMTLNLNPFELAQYLSHGKAHSVAKRYSDAIVIGADTFIVHEGALLGKPHTADKAYEMLARLSGTHHSVLTGVTVIHSGMNKVISDVEETKVYFRDLSEAEIKNYIATGEPLDKAGSYAIQQGGAAFVEKIEGDLLNVVGLPLDRLSEILTVEFKLPVKKLYT